MNYKGRKRYLIKYTAFSQFQHHPVEKKENQYEKKRKGSV